jgi:type II secretory pathway component PulM
MTLKLDKLKWQKLNPIVERLEPYLKELKDYWRSLSEREQFIVKVGVISLGLMFLFLIASSMFNLENSLKESIKINGTNLSNAKMLNLQQQDLATITANEFTGVTSEKVKGDITQLFTLKTPDVALNDNTLIINLPGVKFDLVMLFLDQMRKSYGIFPDKLKIYRSNQSGMVDFYATFNIEK